MKDTATRAKSEDNAETAPASKREESASNTDVLECITKMCTFLGRCSNVTVAVHNNVDNFEKFILQQLSGTDQAKITDFFKYTCIHPEYFELCLYFAVSFVFIKGVLTHNSKAGIPM